MVNCEICENSYCENAKKPKEIVFACNGYKAPKRPQTNADRIRNLGDEALAEHNIHKVKVWNRYQGYHEIMYRCSDGYTIDVYQMALSHELEWLRQPVEDGDNNGKSNDSK